MRKLYILFVFVLSSTVASYAQPLLEIPDVDPDGTGSFCVPVSASFMSDILTLNFNMEYDPAILTFTGVQSINFGNAMSGPLTVSETFAGSGIIEASFIHDQFDCFSDPFPGFEPLVSGNGQTIFELCFDVNPTAIYGECTFISLAQPILVERHDVLNGVTGDCLNLGLLEATNTESKVTIGVRPFVMTASDETASEGELFCVDFSFTGFDELQSAQYTVNYDAAVLQFNSLIPNDEDVPNNTLAGTYGLPTDIDAGPGFITVSWSAPDFNNPPTIPDGTTMFTVCFDVIGACGSPNTLIEFSGDVTPIEFTNGDPDNPSAIDAIPFQFNSGTIQIEECDPTGLEFTVNCGNPVSLDDNPVCVSIEAGTNFQDVSAFSYLIEWNPDLLEYDDYINSNNLFSFGDNDVIEDNVNNGILLIDYEILTGFPGEDLNAGDVIFEICFDIIGLGGDSPIRIIREGGTSDVGGVDIGINPTNCALQIIQPESLGLTFTDIFVPVGDSGCVPVTADNFDALLEVNFSLAWEGNLWEYTGVQNVNPLLGNEADLNITSGPSFWFTDWESPTAVTIPNGEVLFDLCFDSGISAVPDTCDLLQLISLPLAPLAISESSAGQNIGIEVLQEAEMCFLFPEGYAITPVGGSDGWLDTLCVQFEVESWDNILSTDLQITWNPLDLEFVSASDVDIAGWNFNLPDPSGFMNLFYSTGAAMGVPDGTTAFEVCFELIGDPNECYPVSVNTDGQPPTQTTFGEGSVIINEGEICIEEQIVLIDIIVEPASCPGGSDGSVTLVPHEGLANWLDCDLATTWETDPVPTFSPLMIETAMAGDTLCYNVFAPCDGTVPVLTGCVVIPVGNAVPTVMIAGPDTVFLSCNTGLAGLFVENPTDDCTYNWYLNTIESAPLNESFNPNSWFADQPGKYIVECVDNITGCVGQDTVCVFPQQLPIADAGMDPVIGLTCIVDSLVLTGTGTGDGILDFTWTTTNGELDPATANSADVTVYAPGQYCLVVTNPQTGCESAQDCVTVGNDGITPDLCVDETVLEQNCDGSPTIFDVSCSSNPGLTVSFEWLNADSTALSPPQSGLTGQFTELGTYLVQATEESTGCTSITIVEVIQNMSAPSIIIQPHDDFICGLDDIPLHSTVTPDTIPATYLWTTSDGGTISGVTDDASALALTPGIYQVLVTNTDNGCEATAIDTLLDLTAPPIVIITPDADTAFVTCNTPNVTLDATQGSDQGAGFSHQWFHDGVALTDSTDLDIVVNAEGEYVLMSFNTTTNCTGSDTIQVVEDLLLPPINTDGILFYDLNCDSTTITITTSIPDSINYSFGGWDIVDNVGNIVSYSTDSLTIVVDQAGVYGINITNTDNGCFNQADFDVSDNQLLPLLVVAEDVVNFQSCLVDSVQLSGFGSASGIDYLYQWDVVTPGVAPNDPTSLEPFVTAAGEYMFTVLDTTNNCSRDTLITVLADTISPMATIMPVEDLTCEDEVRQATVEVSNIPNFGVTWFGVSPAPDPNPNNLVTADITVPGTYLAVALNQDNACTDSVYVTVNGDITPPEIILAEIPVFECDDESVIIDASGSGDAADFIITWTGATPTGNELIAEVFTLGTVVLNLEFVATGCDVDSMIVINVTDNPMGPDFVGGPTGLFGCDGAPVTIDMSATGDEVDFASIMWAPAAGNTNTITPSNSFIADASGPGVYVLTVIMSGPAACEFSTEVTVEADPDVPIADAGADVPWGCGDVANLDGSASTQGADYENEWLLIGSETAPLTGNITGLMPTLTGSGMYQLIVTNTTNGCADTSEIVTSIFSLPELAEAGDNQIGCDEIIFLDGNAPGGMPAVQGVWTTTSSAVITMNTEAGTEVTDLPFGSSVFVWTLSASSCNDYSVDSVTITRTAGPSANDDILELSGGDLFGELDFISNDQLNGASDFSVNVISGPAIGTFDTTAFMNGNLEFTVGTLTYGLTDMVYELCNVDCPDLCDTATIVINVLTPDGEPFVPNTITPNDDGDNDLFVFDAIILSEPKDIPDNELVVFNRWGDIVYEAQPYANDWGGWNEKGEQLPEGTYYYVLRLNIGEGVIVRGDITIIY